MALLATLCSGTRPRTWMLLLVALAAAGVILACLPWPPLAPDHTLQRQLAALRWALDNLRGALGPDSGGRAACRHFLLRAFRRVQAWRRHLAIV